MSDIDTRVKSGRWRAVAVINMRVSGRRVAILKTYCFV